MQFGLFYNVKLKPKRFTIRVKDKEVPFSPMNKELGSGMIFDI